MMHSDIPRDRRLWLCSVYSISPVVSWPYFPLDFHQHRYNRDYIHNFYSYNSFDYYADTLQ